jgi:DNA end-binding protein Ku
MAARAIASGTISFGLVSIPIKLYTAASSEQVRFNMLHKKCGGRLKQNMVCPVCEEPVERTDTVKGYEYSKGQYVQFSEDELKTMEAEKTDTLDILEFVPASTVDFIYIEKTWYLGPDKGGTKAYRLLSEAMERTQKIAVGRHWTRGKEQLVLVRPYRQGLVLHHVFYANEVRAFDEVDTGGEQTFKPGEPELADRLIEQLTSERFVPEQYKDEYESRVRSAVEQKVAGQEIQVAPEKPQAQIIDLFEALKRSLDEAPAVIAAKSKGPAKSGPPLAAVEDEKPAKAAAGAGGKRKKKG